MSCEQCESGRCSSNGNFTIAFICATTKGYMLNNKDGLGFPEWRLLLLGLTAISKRVKRVDNRYHNDNKQKWFL